MVKATSTTTSAVASFERALDELEQLIEGYKR
jgi:exonuclease VII small subunit